MRRSLRARAVLALAAAAVALASAGCGAYRAVNAPLEQWDPSDGYRPPVMLKDRALGEVVVVLAFSGGGTRAAALSYGILEELRDTTIDVEGGTTRLLDEVDTISSVSGGSLTAAYYGLHGDKIFDEFEEAVLRRNIQRQLLFEWLRPINWIRGFNRFFSRTELAADYYDREIFHGATFADVRAAGGPMIQINATDISAGERFAFTQPHFDFICSDLESFKVSRAVAASTAVPVIFPPLILRNYAGQCGFERPAWLDEALASRESDPRRYYMARSIDGYLDPSKRAYLNLVDGGLSDNLGVRGPLDNVLVTGGLFSRLEMLERGLPRHILFIVVNASTRPHKRFALIPELPSISSVIDSVSGTQIHRYNFETIELLRTSMRKWAYMSSKRGDPLDTHLVEVTFDSITDNEEREYFYNLPTSLTLDDEQVDKLRDIARRLLRGSPHYQGFLDNVQ